MRYPATLLIALAIASAVPTLACIQGSHLLDVRTIAPPKGPMAVPKLEISFAPNTEQIVIGITEETAEQLSREKVEAFEKKPRDAANSGEINDYAASLIFLRRPLEAIPVLEALEKTNPGLYATAANLGTAYELTGDLQRALDWIQTGIKRDPRSHRGTEWLHVAILKCKVQLERDPQWLAAHSVLEFAEDHSAEETVAAIEYQLNERLHFVKGPEPVVCVLLYDAGARVSGESKDERRKYFFSQSLKFGNLRQEKIFATALGGVRQS